MAEKVKDRNKAKCRMTAFLSFLGWMYDIIIAFIFSWIYQKENQVKIFPPTEHKELLCESGVSLARKIRRRELSSEFVVSAYINRIKEVTPVLNAVVDQRFEEALKEAKEVDRFLETTTMSEAELEEKKPFLGIPFTNKESTTAKGMHHSVGLYDRRDTRATEDAEVVRRVKESGAILVGCTNVPELNLWVESRNKVYNQTCNPYNVSRTVGGSSGGEGSIISACGTAIGLGSDIGGSIRIPCYFCGIFGHKPTPNLIPISGIGLRLVDAESMASAGPMSRHAEDLLPFLKVLLDKNVNKLHLEKKVNLQDVNFFYINNPPFSPVISSISGEIKAVMQKAVDHFTKINKKEPEKVYFSGFRYCIQLWKYGMLQETGTPFALALGNMKEEKWWLSEVLKMAIGKCEHTLSAVMCLIDRQLLPSPNRTWAEEELKQLRESIIRTLGDNGVLLFPSSPWLAPYHYQSYFRPHNFGYFAIFNALKFPVTQVPMGLSKEGIPLGIQVVAAPYNDHLCLAVASELEKAFGGWTPPFKTD